MSAQAKLAGPPEGLILNQTLLLGLICCCGFLSTFHFASIDAIPLGLGALMNVGWCYFLYTPMHEAAHRTAHSNSTVNEIVGVVSGLILLSAFPAYRLTHYRHHAHTNDALLDPDALLAGNRSASLFWRLILRLGYDHFYLWQHREWRGRRQQFIGYILCLAGLSGVVYSLLSLGLLLPVLALWILPTVVAGMLIYYTFAYLVHQPHHPSDRGRDLTNPWLRRLMLGQSLHSLHHRRPNVPWFRYAAMEQQHRYIEKEYDND